MPEVRIAAVQRTEFGKGAARRTRRDNRVPAVIHGHGGAKQTGPGREGLRHSFLELTQEKGIAFRNVL